MNQTNPQQAWSRFRFSVIGSLLSSPPQKGDLKACVRELAQKTWRHPLTDREMTLSYSTIERWFYQARKTLDPVGALRTKRRKDATSSRKLTSELKTILHTLRRDHPSWSYKLCIDNLGASITESEAKALPSYSTIYRYMKTQGLLKQRRKRKRFLTGHPENETAPSKEWVDREVRSYEVEYVHGLWHLDFHHSSRKILGKDGNWHKPLILSIMDDHSRLICHAQWYLSETTESLVHGFRQALQKRSLPRALMTDNGSAMISGEFTQGLERLGILHQPTLPRHPHCNGKQEVFWAQLEGRFMAMLEGEEQLSLSLLNDALIAWIEFEYHKTVHSELGTSPLERYLKASDVGRPCPDQSTLTQAFCIESKRKQRLSDGTVSLEGCRFEIPSIYRHLEYLTIRYRRWDLREAFVVDPLTSECLLSLYPQDKAANSTTWRRPLDPQDSEKGPFTVGIAPLLKKHMAEYAATGLPPAYLPKEEGKKNAE